MTKLTELLMVILIIIIMMSSSAKATISVSNVVCQQQYPWNGKIDIDYEIYGDENATNIWIYATGYDKNTDKTIPIRSLSGDGVSSATKIGKHRMTWDSAEDYPSLKSSAFTVTLTAFNGKPLYMVIDLSGGPDATSYPISYLPCEPAGGWTEEYKTSKLVMRYILPGTFTMGSPEDELGRHMGETQHKVTLTKAFYIGVFEVTQKQFELITGLDFPDFIEYWRPDGAIGDTRPVETVFYETIRGIDKGNCWPNSNEVDETSFMGKLRAKTNLIFDLPTDAQWEYACRAGTTTALNNGTNLTNIFTDGNLSKLGRCWGILNESLKYEHHAEVGSYLPNAWGLYDMHGNVSELCLDWYQTDLGIYPVTDPKGASSGECRVLRGGAWGSNSEDCRSAVRCGSTPYYVFDYFSGFRIVLVP